MNTLKNGSKIGKATVVVDIIEKGNEEIRPAIAIKPTFVTYHNTGNTGRGANAKAHNRLIHNMAGKSPRDTSHVSWHIALDHEFIYQHIPFNENAWHTGDGGGAKSGNLTSIGIEICQNSDMTPEQYAQAEENAIALGVEIAKAWKIPVANHVPHQKWSNKYCPRVILDRDKGFAKFHARIAKAWNEANKPAPKPVATSKTTSIVDYLNSIGVDSGFGNRTKIAKANGIANYTGTPEQNTSLLDKIRKSGHVIPPAKPKPVAPAVKVISGINSIGTIQIVGVSNSAIIMDIPNRNVARNIGLIGKGKELPIAGSVAGKNNPEGYWEVIYQGKRAYVSGQFGKLK